MSVRRTVFEEHHRGAGLAGDFGFDLAREPRAADLLDAVKDELLRWLAIFRHGFYVDGCARLLVDPGGHRGIHAWLARARLALEHEAVAGTVLLRRQHGLSGPEELAVGEVLGIKGGSCDALTPVLWRQLHQRCVSCAKSFDGGVASRI